MWGSTSWIRRKALPGDLGCPQIKKMQLLLLVLLLQRASEACDVLGHMLHRCRGGYMMNCAYGTQDQEIGLAGVGPSKVAVGGM